MEGVIDQVPDADDAEASDAREVRLGAVDERRDLERNLSSRTGGRGRGELGLGAVVERRDVERPRRACTGGVQAGKQDGAGA